MTSSTSRSRKILDLIQIEDNIIPTQNVDVQTICCDATKEPENVTNIIPTQSADVQTMIICDASKEPENDTDIVSTQSGDVQMLCDVYNKPENQRHLNASEYFKHTEGRNKAVIDYRVSPVNSGESDADLSDGDPTFETVQKGQQGSHLLFPRTRSSSSSSSSSSTSDSSSSSDSSNEETLEEQLNANNTENRTPEPTRELDGGTMENQDNLTEDTTSGTPTVSTKPKGKKRTRQPENWKQTRAKKLRNCEEACHPSPCGANTKCHVANNQAICTCLPGYRGSPLTGCHHECESDGECGAQQSCRDFKCISPCGDCGVNADCETVAAHRAICKCPRGYHGDPYRICTAECTSDGECPSYKPACIYNACVDPCINACGTNAECHLRGLTPVCSCPRNMTGDPFSYCRPFEARDLCEPNPCGANAKCTPGHDRTGAERPVCTCPTGYIGNALVSCERGECELDSQCPDNLACVGYRCVDPCLGNTQCGSGAVCMARRHIAVCTCPNGRNGDALVNCYDTQSVVATGRYYRYKRDGNYTSQPEPEAPATIVELTEAKTETETKPEEKKE